MRIVLTGASGFIGRPSLALLAARGHDILALSRQRKPAGIAGRVEWVVADLNSPDTYSTNVKTFGPQAALHLAWEGIPDYGLDTSLRNLRNGAVLGQCLFDAGCRHLAVSGSCWEYGKVTGLVHEHDEPVAPSVFGAAKSAQRLLLEAVARTAGASLAWGRVFYPYGPAQKPASLAPTICRAVLSGKRPSLKTPQAVNDFLYVDDTAEALVLLAESAVSGVYNIGSGTGTPVGLLADMALALTGQSPVFTAQVAEGSLPTGFWADTTALRALGWQPRTTLDEGLRRTLDYFRHTNTSC